MASQQVFLRRFGPLIELTTDGQNPLPLDQVQPLAQILSYQHREYLRGKEALNPLTGDHEPLRVETRRMYTFDKFGRFVFPRGFRHRVTQELVRLGYDVQYRDINPPKDPRIYETDFDSIFAQFSFRPQQLECLTQIVAHEGGIIDAAPAFGKTEVMCMAGVVWPNARIDMVVQGKSVMRMLYNRLMKYIGGIGVIGDGQRNEKRITVVSADSLHLVDHRADVVLVDEAHQLMTDHYIDQLQRYDQARGYLFTATADTRFDNAHARMEGLFGPKIFMLSYPQSQALGLVVPIEVHWYRVASIPYSISNIANDVERKRAAYWRNATRNRILAEAARKYVQQGAQVLLLTETVEHVLALRQFLPEFAICFSEQALSRGTDRRDLLIQQRLLQPDEVMTTQMRMQLQQQFEQGRLRAAIANSVWATGVSFDQLQVLGRMDGSASKTMSTQAPGRVCRIDPASGKDLGIVIDAWDEFDRWTLDRSRQRKAVYNKNGWKSVEMNFLVSTEDW